MYLTRLRAIAKVRAIASGFKKVIVFLDSMHTQEHVYAELEAYTPLVSVGSYCVVFDTYVEDMPDDLFPERPWSPGNSPKGAIHVFLERNTQFKIDRSMVSKLMVTVAPDGFLRKIA
jgi:cephalosporin hydroxylase